MSMFKVETIEANRIILVNEEQTYLTVAFNQANKQAIRDIEDDLLLQPGDEVDLDLGFLKAPKKVKKAHPVKSESDEKVDKANVELDAASLEATNTKDELIALTEKEKVEINPHDTKAVIAEAIVAHRKEKSQ